MTAVRFAVFLTQADTIDARERLDAAAVETAREQGVAPLLYAALRDSGRLEMQPAEVVDSLRAAAREAVVIEESRRPETLRVLRALDAACIELLVLKGAALAHTHYAEPSLRPHADVDLLIRKADLSAVTRLFDTLGYTIAPRTSGEHVTHQITFESRESQPARVVFDVHWKVSDPQVFADLFTFENLARDAQPIPALSGARSPGAVHALLLACTHRVAHHYDTEQLIFLFDIDRLARGLDENAWQRVARLATERRIRAVTLRGLELASEYFGTEVPRSVMNALSRRDEYEPTAEYLQPRLRRIDILRSDLDQLGWADRIQLIREHLFPPPSFLLKDSGGKWRGFLPALYLLRIIRGAPAWLRPLRPSSQSDATRGRLLRQRKMLTAAEPLLAAEIALTALATAVALRVLPFAAVLRWTGQRPAGSRPVTVPPARTAVLVDGIARRLPGSTCLLKALVLYTILRRRGLNAEVLVGASRRAGFAAHAWLRCEGELLLGGPGLESYTVLVRVPSQHASSPTAA